MFPLSPPLSGNQRPGPQNRAQLDPGTVLSPFKYRGLFYYSHFEKSLEQASLYEPNLSGARMARGCYLTHK
jgi:hypothetical protein